MSAASANPAITPLIRIITNHPVFRMLHFNRGKRGKSDDDCGSGAGFESTLMLP